MHSHLEATYLPAGVMESVCKVTVAKTKLDEVSMVRVNNALLLMTGASRSLSTLSSFSS